MQIPHGDWICDLCKEIGPSGKFLKCPLCQQIGGAMKRTSLTCETTFFANINPSFHDFLRKCQKNRNIKSEGKNGMIFNDNNPTPFDVWAHLTCVLWLPETYFQDKMSYTIIKGIENIDQKKYETLCNVCQVASKLKIILKL